MALCLFSPPFFPSKGYISLEGFWLLGLVTSMFVSWIFLGNVYEVISDIFSDVRELNHIFIISLPLL